MDEIREVPFLVLEAKGNSTPLTLEIGLFEAHSILLGMEGFQQPAPLTHDLLADILLQTGWKPTGLYIQGLKLGQIHCQWKIQKGMRQKLVEIRPSDGVALSIRMGFPLFVSSEYFYHWEAQSQERNLLQTVLPQQVYLNPNPVSHATIP